MSNAWTVVRDFGPLVDALDDFIQAHINVRESESEPDSRGAYLDRKDFDAVREKLIAEMQRMFPVRR